MATVGIQNAATQFAQLIERAEHGEEVVIERDGKPVARLSPAAPTAAPRQPGSARGLIKIHPNFDDPLPDDLQRYFE
jgi:prevent-host-death family protein